jgi:hypothetical protein
MMNIKNLLVSFILLIICISATAQAVSPKKTKRFHLEISTGLVIPSGLKQSGIDMGALLSIEPRYMLSSNFKIGLRMEAALMYKNIRPSGEWFQSDYLEESGYMLTLDYMKMKNDHAQYFWGIGAGMMDITSDDLDPVTPSVQYLQKTTYACMIRGGIEFAENKLRAGIEYNLVGPASFSRPNHYLSLKLGMMLFTKKRKGFK